jgi:hypothetical protein
VEEVKFLIDRVEDPAAKGMVHAAAGKALDVVVGVAADSFQRMMATIIGQIADAVTAADLSKSPFDLSEVKFTVNAGVDGELSIVSLAKGSVATQSGIEVTLRKKTADG